MHVFYTARFIRSLKKLSLDIQEDSIMALTKFEHKKNHEQLKLHKLTGNMKGYHAFSINYRYRVMVKIEKDVAYCMDIGTHDIYR